MSKRMPWFERVFSFDLAQGMFPNVVERLRGTPARIEDRISGLPGEKLVKRDGDSWSIQENIGHLLDLEPLWLGRLDDLKNGLKTLRPADLENRKTHEANHNATAIESILTSFRMARSNFVEQLDELDEALVCSTALHPRLNSPMRTLDLAFFVAEHDDHHLARITDIMRTFAG